MERSGIGLKPCSTKGCTNIAHKGGVCKRKACMERAGVQGRIARISQGNIASRYQGGTEDTHKTI